MSSKLASASTRSVMKHTFSRHSSCMDSLSIPSSLYLSLLAFISWSCLSHFVCRCVCFFRWAQDNFRGASQSLEQAVALRFDVRSTPMYHLLKARLLIAQQNFPEALKLVSDHEIPKLPKKMVFIQLVCVSALLSACVDGGCYAPAWCSAMPASACFGVSCFSRGPWCCIWWRSLRIDLRSFSCLDAQICFSHCRPHCA